jgi:alpha-galactosidase
VEIESCAGGGGRVDLGILRYTDQVWTSDYTDPFDRLTLQDAFSYAYTPQVMMTWVPDVPHWLNKRTTSLSYRMLASMQGALGIGANIVNWTPEEMALAKRLIAAYHEVQPTITQGDLYRLISPRNGSEFSATQTVRPDKGQSVVFAFIHSTQEGRGFPILKLKGLDPTAQYALTSIEGKSGQGTPAVASGAWWMNHGLELDDAFHGDFRAAAFRLDKK